MRSFAEADDGTKIDPLFANFNQAVCTYCARIDSTHVVLTGAQIAKALDRVIAGGSPVQAAQELAL